MGIVEYLVKNSSYEEVKASFVNGGKAAVAKLLSISEGTVGHVLDRLNTEGWSNLRREKRIRRSDGINPFEKESWIKYYLLGYVVGDGSISYERKYLDTSREVCEFSISSKDKDHLEKIQKIINGGSIRDYRSCNNGAAWSKFRIMSFDIVQSLRKLGVLQSKSKKDTYYNIPDKYTSPFLLGLLDSDGTVSENGSYLTVAWFGRASYLSRFVGWKGLIMSMTYQEQDLVRLNVRKDNEILKRLYDTLYKDAILFLDRKRDKFRNYIGVVYG